MSRGKNNRKKIVFQLLGVHRLCGPTRTLSMGEKEYGLVIINDYSTHTHIHKSILLAHKNESFKVFEVFCESTKLGEVNMTLTLKI